MSVAVLKAAVRHKRGRGWSNSVFLLCEEPRLGLGQQLPAMARGALLLLALAFAAFASADEVPNIKLGVLVPYHTGDSAVPIRLANEW